MDRRAFIKDSGIVLCACASGSAIMAACRTPASVITDAKREGEFLHVPTSVLDGSGFVVITEETLGFPIYVSVKDGLHYAVLLKCSHKGCELKPGARLLKCPCHGSTFKPTGEAVKLPATEPLQTFPVSVSGGVVRIKVG